jgi:hypothetical protein
MAQRMMAMVHAAMFDAVNSIERRYRPYLVQLPADPAVSKEAAAAAAAATVLSTIDDKTAGEMKIALATYLGAIPDGAAKSDGVKLGAAVAAKLLEARRNDGSEAPDAYRPRTAPGVYVPTAITISSMWPSMKPFAIASGSQFRPEPPLALDSAAWAADYNEIKDYGGQVSAKRTAEQTEIARFWLVGPPVAYHPFVRRLVLAKQMSVVDSARVMALVSVGLTDARSSPCSTPSIITISGGRSPRSATAISTATRQPSSRRPGSRSPPRRCIRNTLARIASRAAASRP